jgi:hypothetical protein
MSTIPALNWASYCFTFGPGDSYVALLGDLWSYSPNVSDALMKILNNTDLVHFLVFPTATEYASVAEVYVAYEKKIAIKSTRFEGPETDLCDGLKEWVHSCSRGPQGMQVVGNGKGGWWSSELTGLTKWNDLPLDMIQHLKPGNPHGSVVHVALGINDSYLVRFENGHVIWDLKGCYDTLNERLEGVRTGELFYVSLNPYGREQFFCMFTDRTTIYSFPTGHAWEALSLKILQADALRVEIRSDTLKHSVDRSLTPPTTLPSVPTLTVTNTTGEDVFGDTETSTMTRMMQNTWSGGDSD